MYNTSKYLSRCLDSILKQTYKNIEIIIIDDGSTDDSLKIIRGYAKRNSAIKYFTQNNSGQATARNKGIKYADGEYIMFVDSDDYVSNDFCEVAYNSIYNNYSEIAFFDMYAGRNNSFQKITFNLNEGYVSKENALSTTIDSSFPVNKIYKLSLFDNINYPEDAKYEDLFTTYKLIDASQRVSYVKKALYYYVQRDNSTVHHFTTQNMTDYFNANQQLFNFFEENYPRLSKKMIRSILPYNTP
ncbi:glycosyltransferase [Limosilactobacillus fermentum]